MRRWRSLLLGAGVLVSLTVAGVVELLPSAASAKGQSSAQARATAQALAAPQRVIVVLKNQVSSLPPTRADIGARKQAIAGLQAPVKSQLSSSAASNVHSFDVINAVSATVPKSAVAKLKSNPAVSQVVPDQIISLGPTQTPGPSTTVGPPTAPLPGACPAPGKVQLNPQALPIIHADSDNPGAKTARSLGIDGTGVTVAFIADGLDINNQDFIRANGSHVFVDYKDFTGLGTAAPTGGEEAFGDASSIAAQGLHTYDVSHYSALPLDRPCDIRVEGVAPGASLVGLDAFGTNQGFNSAILQAIDYAVTVDHVQVLNESFGSNNYPDDEASLDLIKQADDLAVAAGTTVTVSSGDAGVTNTIGSPATDPNVISAGATTTYRLDVQNGYGGSRFPGVTGWLDDNISSFSSGGFDQNGRTVDVVAPGELNWIVCSTDVAIYSECTNFLNQPSPVIQFGGTSESAPLTAGVAALVIQAYRNTHGGASPSPAVVKQIITSTTDDIYAPAEQQGTGRIDAYKAVLAAESYRAAASRPKPVGQTLVTSADQLNAVDDPGTPETLTDTVTNLGQQTQTIAVSGRALGAYTTVKTAQVTLNDTTSQHMLDWQGFNDNVEKVTFTVPKGQDRLSASIAYSSPQPESDLSARVRITLIDPAGRLAAYSVPQGNGNYGNVQVRSPLAGQWTAYIYSRPSSAGGTTGPVQFGASVARYVTFGGVTPGTLTLASGQSGQVTVHTTTPATPGDASGSIVLTSSVGPAFGRTTTIPVTLRSLIPNGRQSFTQTLTGGNGREVTTGQEFYYQLDVRPGRPELNATITLADNPRNLFSAFLISPTGEALAFASNQLPTTPNPTDELGAQLHVLSPAQGAWTLILAFAPQVSGEALSEPFTVTTSQAAVPASAPGLPDSPTVKLAAGQATTVNVRVRNNSSAAELYFVDARLASTESAPLVAQTTDTVTEPLNFSEPFPEYLIPTNTTAFTAGASTTGPQAIQFDTASPFGDPDLASTQGLSVTAALTANPISQGEWSVLPVEVGPFGPTPGPTETATTSMAATFNAFDPAVTSPTGDLWLASTDPTQLNNLRPVLVFPGQTATIPVTITPAGASGTSVTGTLYVDDADLAAFGSAPLPNGNQVASFPYSYTVK